MRWGDSTPGTLREYLKQSDDARTLVWIDKYGTGQLVVHFDEVTSTRINFADLRDRKYDLMLRREPSLQAGEHPADDLNVEFLFDDPLVVAAGMQTRWARRRRIDLAELVDEPWIMQAPHTLAHQRLAEAVHARGLAMPRACSSPHVRSRWRTSTR